MKRIQDCRRSAVLFVCSVAWAWCAVFALPSHAQDYPNKPIRVVIAGGAGSSPDSGGEPKWVKRFPHPRFE